MNNLKLSMTKVENEKRILEKMIFLFCRKKHHTSNVLCQGCEALRTYALDRLSRCPFKEDKTACKDCKVHCYQNDKRIEIREVMRFSGPRMLLYYPIDFIRHILI